VTALLTRILTTKRTLAARRAAAEVPAWRRGGEARRGAMAMAPMLIGYAPFAAVVGATVAAQQERLAAWAGTWLIYSGAAQLAVLGALGSGSGLALTVAAGMIVNARLLVYSAALAPHWRTEQRWVRTLAAALLTDAVWALASRRYSEPGTPSQRRWYYFGAALTLWSGWVAMVTAAAMLGDRFKVDLGLGLAAPLCLLFLVAPALRTSGGRASAGAAALVALGAEVVAVDAGLVAAVSAGSVAGLLMERRNPR
jgi:predicted branched-subunit amino acid permease